MISPPPPSVWIRPARLSDQDAFFELIQKISTGITSLPQVQGALQNQLIESERSFSKNPSSKTGYRYLFFIETDDPLFKKKQIIGCAAIRSCGSHHVPFYHFKILKEQHFCPIIKHDKTQTLLVLCNDYQYATEIGSLFLMPEARGLKLGPFLSRSRFLFLRAFKHLFDPLVISEMRGIITPNGGSPFWNALAGRFIDLPFAAADKLTGQGEKNFIATLMPRYPIYTVFLPQEAQEVIGAVHPETLPAFTLLQREGFRYKNYVDLFDGGPNVECDLNDIYSVRTAQEFRLAGTTQSGFTDPRWWIVSNQKMDFRSCISCIHVTAEGLLLPESVQLQLGALPGDPLLAVPYFSKKT